MERFEHDGLLFDVSDSGPPDGRVVVMLHGFPEDRHCWDALGASVAGAGYRVLAPDQRGYSPGAQPTGRRDYTVDKLAGDVLALADAAGAERIDVVGHDWGAPIGWYLASHRPERVRSLTALAVPHPAAVQRAVLRSSQVLRSWYMGFFQLPWLPEAALGAAGGASLARALERTGLDPETAARYARRATSTGLRGPINWYRGGALTRGAWSMPSPVPTLFVWGSHERFITRAAAEACGRYVTGPYRFVELAEGDHWLPHRSASQIAPLLLAHLEATAG